MTTCNVGSTIFYCKLPVNTANPEGCKCNMRTCNFEDLTGCSFISCYMQPCFACSPQAFFVPEKFFSVYLSVKLIMSLKQSATAKIKLQGYNFEFKFGIIPCWTEQSKPECIFWGDILSNEAVKPAKLQFQFQLGRGSAEIFKISERVPGKQKVGNHWAIGY